MIKDKNGKEVKVGDVCFYSERPHSNYADSLIVVYETQEDIRVGCLLVNYDDEYILCGKHPKDLRLYDYQLNLFHEGTGVCEELEIVQGLSEEEATIEYANHYFPLDK